MGQRVLQGRFTVWRYLVFSGLTLILGFGVAFAQSGTPLPPDQSGKTTAGSADAARDNQRKTDEFAEAAQAVNGPAGNPECVWLGRRVVRLMWRDDLDTAFRHLDLYDRFGCPGGHVQAAFRCLTRFGGQIDDKVQKSLDDRVHACWINPNAQPQAAATPTAPSASPSAAASAPAASPAPAAPK
ncbi:MAG TPA: beta-1-3, beta-1-6-glucan biosynthesis protein [Bradyrhizobium sp.]|nr:beta-1-3, beta-1-6-glucan biosynthesis protein [Bradyrhizobium sp.]